MFIFKKHAAVLLIFALLCSQSGISVFATSLDNLNETESSVEPTNYYDGEDLENSDLNSEDKREDLSTEPTDEIDDFGNESNDSSVKPLDDEDSVVETSSEEEKENSKEENSKVEDSNETEVFSNSSTESANDESLAANEEVESTTASIEDEDKTASSSLALELNEQDKEIPLGWNIDTRYRIIYNYNFDIDGDHWENFYEASNGNLMINGEKLSTGWDNEFNFYGMDSNFENYEEKTYTSDTDSMIYLAITFGENTLDDKKYPVTIPGKVGNIYTFKIMSKTYAFVGFKKDETDNSGIPDYYFGGTYDNIFEDANLQSASGFYYYNLRLYPCIVEYKNEGPTKYDAMDLYGENQSIKIEYYKGYLETSTGMGPSEDELYNPYTGTATVYTRIDEWGQFQDQINNWSKDPGDDPYNINSEAISNPGVFQTYLNSTGKIKEELGVYEPINTDNFSITIPGDKTKKYYSPLFTPGYGFDDSNKVQIIGFSPTKAATEAVFKIGETYNDFLRYFNVNAYGNINIKLYPVFKSVSSGGGGGSEVRKFIFNVDSRKALFKNGQEKIEFAYGTDLSDFNIPWEKDIQYNGVSNNYESNDLFLGWVRYKPSYTEGDISTFTDQFGDNNYRFKAGNYYDGVTKYLTTQQIIDAFKIFNNKDKAPTADVELYAMYVARPVLRFYIRHLDDNNGDDDKFNSKYLPQEIHLAKLKNPDGSYASSAHDYNQLIEYRYGDPNTQIPEVELTDPDNYYFDVDNNNWARNLAENELGVVDLNEEKEDGWRRRWQLYRERSSYIKDVVEMWKNETFEWDAINTTSYDAGGGYNRYEEGDLFKTYSYKNNDCNLAHLVFESDVLHLIHRSRLGYYFDEQRLITQNSIPGGVYLVSSLNLFEFSPVIMNKRGLVEYSVDKNLNQVKNATIDQAAIDAIREDCLLEYRALPTEDGTTNDTYDIWTGVYKSEMNQAMGYGSNEVKFFYVSSPNVAFKYGVDILQPKNIKMLVLKDEYENNSNLQDFEIVARDANGSIAYKVQNIGFTYIDGPKNYGNDIIEKVRFKTDSTSYLTSTYNPYNIDVNFLAGNIEDNKLKLKLLWEPEKLKINLHYYDKNDPSFYRSGSYNDVYPYLTTASQIIDYFTKRGYTLTSQDIAAGYTNAYLDSVSVRNRDSVTTDDDEIKLINIDVDLYIVRARSSKLTFVVDKNKATVTGKTEYYDVDTITSPSVVGKTDTNGRYVFEGWSLSSSSNATVLTDAELDKAISDWKNDTSDSKPDKEIYAKITYKPYETYTIIFATVSNMSWVPGTSLTQYVRENGGSIDMPSCKLDAGYKIAGLNIRGEGAGSSSYDTTNIGLFNLTDEMISVAGPNKTIYVSFLLEKIKYTIEIVADSGNKISYTGNTTIQDVTIGDSFTIPNVNVTGGYHIVGFEIRNMHQTDYIELSRTNVWPSVLTAKMIEYARYQTDKYYITFRPVADVFKVIFDIDDTDVASASFVSGTRKYDASVDEADLIPPVVKANNVKWVFAEKWKVKGGDGTALDDAQIRAKYLDWKSVTVVDDLIFLPVFRISHTFTFVIPNKAFEPADNAKLVYYEAEANSIVTPIYTERTEYVEEGWNNANNVRVNIADEISAWKTAVNNKTATDVVYELKYREVSVWTFEIDPKDADVSGARMSWNTKDIRYDKISTPAFVRKAGRKLVGWQDKQTGNKVLSSEWETWDGKTSRTVKAIFTDLTTLKFIITDSKYGSFLNQYEFDEETNIISKPDIKVETGYKITGYRRSPGNNVISNSDIDNDVASWSRNENVTYTVLFDTLKTIEFVFNNEEVDIDTSIHKTKFDESDLTTNPAAIGVPPHTPKTGYIFDKYEYEGAVKNQTEIDAAIDDWKNGPESTRKNIVIYVKYRKMFTLEFIIDTAKANTTGITLLYFENVDVNTIVIPDLTGRIITGYKLDKWTKNNAAINDIATDVKSWTKKENVKYVAQFAKIKTFTFVVEKGYTVNTLTDAETKFDELRKPSVPPTVNPVAGFLAGGWSRQAYGTILTDAEVSDIIDDWNNRSDREDMVLYYVFRDDPSYHKIRFKVDDTKGSFDGHSPFFMDESLYRSHRDNISVNTIGDYIFIGWQDDDDPNIIFNSAADIHWDGQVTKTYHALFRQNTNPSPNHPSGGNGGNGGGGGGGGGGKNPQTNNPPDTTKEEKIGNAPSDEYIVVVIGDGSSYKWETKDRIKWRIYDPSAVNFYKDGWALLEYRGTIEWYHFASNEIMDTGWFTENGNLYYLQTDSGTTYGKMYTGVQTIDGVTYQFAADGKLVGIVGYEQVVNAEDVNNPNFDPNQAQNQLPNQLPNMNNANLLFMDQALQNHTIPLLPNNNIAYINNELFNGRFQWDTLDGKIWKLVDTYTAQYFTNGWAYMEYMGTKEWYHFNVASFMDTGWYGENGKIYYFQTEYNTTYGKMLTGIHTIDGMTYQFGDDGALISVLF